ncbi:hypothetical protein DSO57_1006797 [Entomophthora muscae]|uniref:Uncharacterized protein n=1 Tax=Entomophthora muscae TaxID=34485 RepID=A0ACC2S9R6_9FUNG|nr:hypothetical protein DSO57_1006797 [Entomophthora muscae]
MDEEEEGQVPVSEDVTERLMIKVRAGIKANLMGHLLSYAEKLASNDYNIEYQQGKDNMVKDLWFREMVGVQDGYTQKVEGQAEEVRQNRTYIMPEY